MTLDHTTRESQGQSPNAAPTGAASSPLALAPQPPRPLGAPAPHHDPATGAAPHDDLAAATQLHALIEHDTVQTRAENAPGRLLLGQEAAADLRLGSTRQLTHRQPWNPIDGPQYPELTNTARDLLPLLERLGQQGHLAGALAAYERRYGQNFYAVLGERVRDPNLRAQLLKVLPPPIPEAQLTEDAFLEQLAVGFVYQNEGAGGVQGMAQEPRRHSSPATILETFGYQAGSPVSGKWGFQMRVFLPVKGKARWPNPVVAFRGTEGVGFDASGASAARQKPTPGQPLDPNRVGHAVEGTLDTVVGDAAPAGVGYNQFEQNAELIARVVGDAHRHGPLIMTGHSLGGALAQLAAARFVDQTARCVTFQSPGIDRADVERVQRFNAAHPQAPLLAHHYRVDGDVVPTAGEQNLPGEIHYFDRVTRPGGSRGPYEVEPTSYLSLNATRATAGHVSPMLSTYLQDQPPLTGDLGTLAASGLHDEASVGQNARDVGMVYGGRYRSDRDPRLNEEATRRSTGSLAMRKTGMYEAVYFENIAYNSLLERVERLAADKQYATFAAFRTAAVQLIASSDRLPLSPRDLALGQQFQLPTHEPDYRHPMFAGEGPPVYPQQDALFAVMRTEGVTIPDAVRMRVRRELARLWTAWHPGQQADE